jgi:hypothetical protein
VDLIILLFIKPQQLLAEANLWFWLR